MIITYGRLLWSYLIASDSVRADSSGEALHVIVEKIESNTREAVHEHDFHVALGIVRAYAE